MSKKSTKKEPVPHNIKLFFNHKISISKNDKILKTNDKVTSSELEYAFMRNFLDKLGIKYVHQWTAPTKRIYDFAIMTNDGNMIDYLIEIQGTFYHADPRFYDRENLKYANQKKQIIIDEQKKEWASLNGYLLLQIFEEDIKKHPKKILNMLKKRSMIKKTDK